MVLAVYHCLLGIEPKSSGHKDDGGGLLDIELEVSFVTRNTVVMSISGRLDIATCLWVLH
jgi:hypothetical protein